MVWLRDGEKKFEDIYNRFDTEYLRVTDGQISCDGIALRGKKKAPHGPDKTAK